MGSNKLEMKLEELKERRRCIHNKGTRLLMEHKKPKCNVYESIEDHLESIEEEADTLDGIIEFLENIITNKDEIVKFLEGLIDNKDDLNNTTPDTNIDNDIKLGLNIDINEEVSEDVKKKLKSLITTRKGFSVSVMQDLKEIKHTTEIIKHYLEKNVDSIDIESIDKEITVIEWMMEAILTLKGNNDGTIKLKEESHTKDNEELKLIPDDKHKGHNELKEMISAEITSSLEPIYKTLWDIKSRIDTYKEDTDKLITNSVLHLENIIKKQINNINYK